MTTINPSLTYTDGHTLDTDGHNKNIYTTGTGEGILSVANGGLDDTNLESAFVVEESHVGPEEAVRIRADWKLDTTDYLSDAFDSKEADQSFTPVAGTAARIYLPYSPTVVVWEWTMFLTFWRWRIETDDDTIGKHAIGLLAYHVDPSGTETALMHTYRTLPVSAILDQSDGTFKNREARNGLLFDQTHILGSPDAGWHEIHIRLWMKRFELEGDLAPGLTVAETSIKYDSKFYQRASFGICNSRVMALL